MATIFYYSLRGELFSQMVFIIKKNDITNQIYLGPKDPGSATRNFLKNYFVPNHSLGLRKAFFARYNRAYIV